MPARSELFVIVLFCVIPICLALILAVTRPSVRRRRMAIICHRCGRPEEIDRITDATVGVWGEKLTCTTCKEERDEKAGG